MSAELTKKEEKFFSTAERLAKERFARGFAPITTTWEVYEALSADKHDDVCKTLYSLFLKGRLVRLCARFGGDNISTSPSEMWTTLEFME